MSRRTGIIHGTWVPHPDHPQKFELAIYPIMQLAARSGERYIPDGSFWIANLLDAPTLDKALTENYVFQAKMVLDEFKTPKAGEIVTALLEPDTHIPRLNLHNLGEFTDEEGFEYDVFLVIPRSVSMNLKDSAYTWEGMYLLGDIELEEDERFEQELLEALRLVRGPGE